MSKYNIDAILHRIEDGVKSKKIVAWVRSYARIETAVRRIMEYLIFEGQVGDVVELVLRTNQMQVGTIKMSATSKVSVVWNDTEAKRLKSEQILNRAAVTTAPTAADLFVESVRANNRRVNEAKRANKVSATSSNTGSQMTH